MKSKIGFDAQGLAAKLQRAAAELRWQQRHDLATEYFARRLEAHADAMLRPEAALRERFSKLQETRLVEVAGR